jgi:hypothetical protein
VKALSRTLGKTSPKGGFDRAADVIDQLQEARLRIKASREWIRAR